MSMVNFSMIPYAFIFRFGEHPFYPPSWTQLSAFVASKVFMILRTLHIEKAKRNKKKTSPLLE